MEMESSKSGDVLGQELIGLSDSGKSYEKWGRDIEKPCMDLSRILISRE